MENFVLNNSMKMDLPHWLATLSGIEFGETVDPDEDVESFPYGYGAAIGRAINRRYEAIEEKIFYSRRAI